MTRLTALNPDQASGKTNELFLSIEKKFGVIPNMMRTMGNSSALLEAYLNFSGNLSAGTLGNRLGALIALAVAEANQCQYCASAHTYLGANLNKIDEATMLATRTGVSIDKKTDAALKFARILVMKRGKANDEDVKAVKEAGFTQGEIAEIIGHVALNTFTNYFNNTAGTVVDFPVVELAEVATV
ncbi:MAG: carboxymuconolactone decarboxylase family protein [Flammeovirgaceae bacterium]|nr:carboxymuconolactone decarboxylase family protein [Flammeovirgaceae bacterium]